MISHKLEPEERELVEDYLAAQAELQAALARLVGADADELGRNQRLVWAWDSISLALCLQWRTLTLDGFTLTQTATDRFELDPWPFRDEELQVRCEGRLLDRRYGTESELHAALDVAPSVPLSFTMLRRAWDGTRR